MAKKKSNDTIIIGIALLIGGYLFFKNSSQPQIEQEIPTLPPIPANQSNWVTAVINILNILILAGTSIGPLFQEGGQLRGLFQGGGLFNQNNVEPTAAISDFIIANQGSLQTQNVNSLLTQIQP